MRVTAAPLMRGKAQRDSPGNKQRAANHQTLFDDLMEGGPALHQHLDTPIKQGTTEQDASLLSNVGWGSRPRAQSYLPSSPKLLQPVYLNCIVASIFALKAPEPRYPSTTTAHVIH